MMLSGQADERQRQAITAEGHQLVSACPGAGKTRVLALRSAHLLTSNPRGRLVAVTFTRDAAKSLRQRILDKSGAEYRGRVASGTFHALALNQLRRASGMPRLRILSGNEQEMFMRQAWERSFRGTQFNFDEFDDAREAIEGIKASAEAPPDPKTTPHGAVYQLYQQLLERSGVCDFSDLLLQSISAMRAGTLKPMGVRWMLVDEAQDMDDVQYAWVMAHVKAGVEVMCVADDDQSIYQWRHALGYAGLMRFVKDTGARHLTLDTNYRCKPEVLTPAVALINKNEYRVSKNIRAASTPGGDVAVVANATRWDEVARMASHIAYTGATGWGILGRTNRILDAAELALASEGVPYQRIGGKKFWDKPAAQAYLGLLKSVTDSDPVALLQSLRWAGLFRQASIEPEPSEDAGALLKRLGQHAQGDSLTAAQRSARTLALLRQDWQEAAERGRISLIAWGAAQWLAGCVNEKKGAVFEWCAEALCRTEGTLAARLTLLTMASQPKQKDDRVQIMTMHSSKGLEFPHIWLMACEDGVCPHSDSETEEERRLFYVGMTRAEHDLVLSFSRDGEGPTPFIEEAGLSHIVTNEVPVEFMVESPACQSS